MKIDDLLLKLDERLKLRSHFGFPSHNFEHYVSNFQRDKNALGLPFMIHDDSFESSDMALLGPGDQRELGNELGLPLPEDYLKFCSRFEEYISVGQSAAHIWNATEAKDTVLTFRNILDIDPRAPHRLFHFASIFDLTGFYSFRWSADYKKMDVVFVWDYGDVSVNDLLGPKGDRFVCDTSFTSWLSRMIETDGRPLFPGKRWPMADGGWFEDNFPYFKRLHP